jgi:hypothetical protein
MNGVSANRVGEQRVGQNWLNATGRAGVTAPCLRCLGITPLQSSIHVLFFIATSTFEKRKEFDRLVLFGCIRRFC